jgi:hypothetical protein
MVLAMLRRSKPRKAPPAPKDAGTVRWMMRFATGTLLLLSATALSAATADERFSGPDIVIIAEDERTIYEFRQGGELRMVQIVPKIGRPYYLVPRDPTRGFGDLERADMLIPSWVILEF